MTIPTTANPGLNHLSQIDRAINFSCNLLDRTSKLCQEYFSAIISRFASYLCRNSDLKNHFLTKSDVCFDEAKAEIKSIKEIFVSFFSPQKRA